MPGNRRGLEVVPERGNSFLARYGSTVLRGGIAAIPTALFTYQARLGLSPQEAWFISYILAHKWDEDLPYPSLRKMSEATDVSVRQLHRIKDGVVEKGYLLIVPRHRDNDGGQDSNAYDFSGLFERITELLSADGRFTEQRQQAPYADEEPAALRAAAPVTVKSASEVVSTPVKKKPAAKNNEQLSPVSLGAMTLVTPPSDTGVTGAGDIHDSDPSDTNDITPYDTGDTGAGDIGDIAPSDIGDITPVSPMSHEKKHGIKSRRKEDNSNQFSQFVMAVANDFSREFGDTEHAAANMSQANRLWRDSQLGEDKFVELMQEARRRTRQSQGGQGAGMIQNKAAYFFSVLRALLLD